MKTWLVILALLVAGLWFQLGLLVYAMYALIGLMLASRFLSRVWIDAIDAERAPLPPQLEIGETATVTVDLQNRGALPIAWLLVEDSAPHPAAGVPQQSAAVKLDGATLRVLQLSPRGEGRVEYNATFQRRGYHQFGPLLIESGDLFGLHRRYRVVTRPQFVTVLPRVVPVPNYNLASRRPAGELRYTHRLFEDPTRINGIREYQRGDPFNRIHWRATARARTLQCKTFEPSCVAGLTVLLDFHEAAFAGDDGPARAELAVTTAASLCNAVHLQRQQVGLVSNGRDAVDRITNEGFRHGFRSRSAAQAGVAMKERSDRLRPVIVETRRGESQMGHILESLARLELTDGLTLPQLVDEARSRLPRNATIAAILGDLTEPSAWALGSLAQSGFSVVAILVGDAARAQPGWAQSTGHASILLANGVQLRAVSSEEDITQLCSGTATALA